MTAMTMDDQGDLSIHGLFEQQAALTPAATALVCGSQRVSYAELDAWSDRIAQRLVDAGTERGTVVAVHLDRGPRMVAAVLATLKAGAAYLMLDPEFPVQRLRAMVNATVATVLIVETSEDVDRLGIDRPSVLTVDDGPRLDRGADRTRPAEPACVMFTSGSTGQPKGAIASHHAVVSTLVGQRYVQFGADTVWLQCAPVSWDAFALELWGALLFGGCCVLYPGRRPDPLVIARVNAECRVTTMYLSSGLFNVVVDEFPAALAGLREIVVGGEALSVRHVKAAMTRWPGLRVVNGYGPVEGMIFVTTHPVAADDLQGDRIPIGDPLAGKQAHVLDTRLRPVADSVIGELYAAGSGLADGYVGQPGLSAERFVANPFTPGARMYRTGDLARRHPDGRLEFCGRSDGQFKVRGFRIEPGEVEAALARNPDIAQVAVAAEPDALGENQLTAYVVARREFGPPAALTAALLQHTTALLPAFMVPSKVVILDALPLTASGKVDRSALTPIGHSVPTPALPPSEPDDAVRTPLELRLIEIWAQVLGVPQVGLHDDFFSLGGNSLRAVRVAARIVISENLPATVSQIFATPNIAELAAALALSAASPEPSIPRRSRIPNRSTASTEPFEK